MARPAGRALNALDREFDGIRMVEALAGAAVVTLVEGRWYEVVDTGCRWRVVALGTVTVLVEDEHGNRAVHNRAAWECNYERDSGGTRPVGAEEL